MAKSTPPDVYTSPPRQNVMLLSCMDQRLLDDIVRFMDDLNLQNRYDQVILAGAAMGAAKLATPLPQFNPPSVPPPAPPCEQAPPFQWRHVFFDHLLTAIEGLERPIRDIFLLEHVDCGAYKKLHPDENTRVEYEKCSHADEWRPFHAKEVTPFAAEVVAFCNSRPKRELWHDFRVWSLLMDLRGEVETLGCLSTESAAPAKRSETRPARRR